MWEWLLGLLGIGNLATAWQVNQANAASEVRLDEALAAIEETKDVLSPEEIFASSFPFNQVTFGGQTARFGPEPGGMPVARLGTTAGTQGTPTQNLNIDDIFGGISEDLERRLGEINPLVPEEYGVDFSDFERFQEGLGGRYGEVRGEIGEILGRTPSFESVFNEAGGAEFMEGIAGRLPDVSAFQAQGLSGLAQQSQASEASARRGIISQYGGDLEAAAPSLNALRYSSDVARGRGGGDIAAQVEEMRQGQGEFLGDIERQLAQAGLGARTSRDIAEAEGVLGAGLGFAEQERLAASGLLHEQGLDMDRLLGVGEFESNRATREAGMLSEAESFEASSGSNFMLQLITRALEALGISTSALTGLQGMEFSGLTGFEETVPDYGDITGEIAQAIA